MAVYAICDNNCKYETMTKEQIVSMLQQLIETGSLADVDAMKDLTVAAIKETHAGQDIKFWVGTEAEYNAIVPTVAAGFVMARIDENGAVYLCTDDSTMQGWHDTAVADAAAAAAEVIAEVAGHASRTDNPHGVTAAQVGAVPKTVTLTNKDINTIVTDGFYFISGNKPSTNDYHIPDELYNSINNYWELSVIVFAIGSRICQIAIMPYNSISYYWGKMWIRSGINSGQTWNAWKLVSTTADLAKYLPLTGGTLTGQMRINMSNTADIPQIQLLNTANDKTARVELSTTGSLQLWTQTQSGGTNNSTYLRIGAQDIATENALMLNRRVNGKNTLYNVYGTNNVTCGTTDITAGGALATDCYYDVIE